MMFVFMSCNPGGLATLVPAGLFSDLMSIGFGSRIRRRNPAGVVSMSHEINDLDRDMPR
jgi:hypothetical protein